MACEEVASARWVFEFLSVFSNSGTPGRGCVVGKNCACNAACLAVKVERATGSCAQAWKISAACGIGQSAWGCGERGFGRREAYVGTRTALQLGLDFPGKRGLAVLMQDYVVAFGVDIFGIDEQSVHVKETGADFRESGVQCQFKEGLEDRARLLRVCHNHDGGIGVGYGR